MIDSAPTITACRSPFNGGRKKVSSREGLRRRHNQGRFMETLKVSSDTLFILLGAIMVLAMHSGFAFLELGTVRRKNQVNALVKILCDFSMSTIASFFAGYL